MTIEMPKITNMAPMTRVMRRWKGSSGSTSPPTTRPCMNGRVSRRAHSLLNLIIDCGRRAPATPMARATAPRSTSDTSTSESSATPSIDVRRAGARDAGHAPGTRMVGQVSTQVTKGTPEDKHKSNNERHAEGDPQQSLAWLPAGHMNNPGNYNPNASQTQQDQERYVLRHRNEPGRGARSPTA
jgi:hypothetical protein